MRSSREFQIICWSNVCGIFKIKLMNYPYNLMNKTKDEVFPKVLSLLMLTFGRDPFSLGVPGHPS
jgi:hypothetical protein